MPAMAAEPEKSSNANTNTNIQFNNTESAFPLDHKLAIKMQ